MYANNKKKQKREQSTSPAEVAKMVQGGVRSSSSPPDFPSSFLLCSTTDPATRAYEDETVLSPSPQGRVNNALLDSKPSSALPTPFASPAKFPGSERLSSLSPAFAFKPAPDSTCQRPSSGISSSRTADCASPLPFSLSSGVRSCSNIRVRGRVDDEEVCMRSAMSAGEGVYVLPSHRIQTSPASQSSDSETERNGNHPVHHAEYFSAGEENGVTPALSSCSKCVSLTATSLGVDRRRSRWRRATATTSDIAKPSDDVDSTFVTDHRPCPVLCPRAAEACTSTITSTRVHGSPLGGRVGIFQALGAEHLAMERAPQEHRTGIGEKQHHPQQQWQGGDAVRQHCKKVVAQFLKWSNGQQAGQQDRKEVSHQCERRVQRRSGCDVGGGLTSCSSKGVQQCATSFSRGKSAEVQLLLERMRMFYISSSDATGSSSKRNESAVPFLGSSNGENNVVEDFFSSSIKTPSRPSCAEKFRIAAARLQHVLCSSKGTKRTASGLDTYVKERQWPPQQQASQKEVQKRGQVEANSKKKKYRDRRLIFVSALLVLDVIIIGSTSTQHALNPASLVDKVLLTHVSFSASLCSLSAGSAAAVAECLASAASGNAAAAAAASSVAAENTVEKQAGLLSREEVERHQVELPQLHQQLLQEPYLLPHYERYLPHSLKRELGLSCVCGWAALVVLGVLCLWVAVHDTSLAARVFPAVIATMPDDGSSASKREERLIVNDSSSIRCCSGESNNASSSSFISSRESSPCSSQTRGKEMFSSVYSGIADFPTATCCTTSCSSSRSSRIGCARSSCSKPLSSGVSSGTRRVIECIFCPWRRKKIASGYGGRDIGKTTAAVEERRLGRIRSRKKKLRDVYSIEAAEHLRLYEETVLQEYQARVVIEARARLFSISLLALLIFFGMNFIVQLNVRCHRTKYHLYTVQALAAAARGSRTPGIAAEEAGRGSSSEQNGEKRDLPTTPNTPLLPLQLLLHAQQPAAASSAFYFNENGEEVAEEQHQNNGAEVAVESLPGGQRVQKGRRSRDEEKPPTSPSYVYYRDYQFWYHLFIDSCRDAEMLLSIAWILLHITAVTKCRNMMTEAEEHVRATICAFRRQNRHVCRGIHC